MSDIKLVSEEYTSKFVTGPELTQELSQKQDTLQWYNESGSGSMDPYKVDIASNIVTLRSGDDTVGMISEDTKLELSSGISIKTSVGGPWRNILSTDIEDNVWLGDSDNVIKCNGPLYDRDGNEITGGGSGPSFNYISEGHDWHTSLLLGQGPDGDVANSVFICGPLYGNEGSIFVAGPIVFNEAYDKDGKKITGGGSGGGSKWISDDIQEGKTILNLGYGSAGTVNSIFVCGPIKMYHESSPWCGATTIGIQENVMGLGGFEIKYEGDNGTKTCIGIASDTTWDDAVIQINMYKYDGTLRATLTLDGYKLEKLNSLIYNADALLALLKNQ